MGRFSRRGVLKAIGGMIGYSTLFPGKSMSAILRKIPAISSGDPVHTTRIGNGIQIENGEIRAEFHPTPNGIAQTYFVATTTGWEPQLVEFRPSQFFGQINAPLYRDQGDSQQYRLCVSECLQNVSIVHQSDSEAMVSLAGVIGSHRIEQLVSLHRGERRLRVKIVSDIAGEDPRLEYLLSTFMYPGKKSPEFSHVPAMKRSPDDIIADRIFNSPAALIQHDGFLIALVPDLDLLNSDFVYATDARPVEGSRGFRVPVDPERISFPAVLDLELHPGENVGPVLSFGLADYITEQHVYWRHENREGAMVRKLSANRVCFGFDLILQAEVPPDRGYQTVTSHLWNRYGSAWLHRSRPQTMPLAEYARVCFPAAFAYHGDTKEDTTRYSQREPYDPSRSGSLPTWLEFDLNGVRVGGIRATPAQWYSDIQYSPWWNNARDAVGMYWWGTKGDRSLVEKARKMIALALLSPQNNGIFPSVFRYNEKRWVGCYWKFAPDFNPDWTFPDHWDPTAYPKFWDFGSDWYQTSAASLTCAHLLRFRRLCEDIPHILSFSARYGDFLVDHVRSNGCMPAWFSPELHTNRVMEFNAEGGVHIWALSELYLATGKRKYLEAANLMAAFLIREVLPKQRWSDFETFYSCAVKPENIFDRHTGQYPQCTTSMMWAVQGLTVLARAGGDARSLSAAEAVADYSLFFQACWQPHFINTAYAYGGFRSQNSDAEWLDMRSSSFAEAFAELAELSKRQDLLERAVAAMRSAFAIINHPRNIKNAVFRFPRYPTGLEPENIDHEGLPQVPLRSGFDWGEGGALAGAATLLRKFGGVYIDAQHRQAVGIDGVAVKNFSVSGRTIRLTLVNQIDDLPFPYKNSFKVELRVIGLDSGEYDLVLNECAFRHLSSVELRHMQIKIQGGSYDLLRSPAVEAQETNNKGISP